jgi:DNA-directed RNA polymerase specialized sigma24 family protein
MSAHLLALDAKAELSFRTPRRFARRPQARTKLALPCPRATLALVSTSSHTAPPDTQSVFATTHWSAALSAGRNDTTRARDALAALCQAYWPALHAYVRRRGYSPPDAEDLTQEFFARLVEHNWIARADEQKGRFRSFLLTALNRFLADEWDKGRAQKRGGGMQAVPLDSEIGVVPQAEDVPADQVYDRHWAFALLERTMARLRAEFAHARHAAEFEHLKCSSPPTEAKFPTQPPLREPACPKAPRAWRFIVRKRYRELFREEIARTVSDPSEVEAELRYLISVLAAR